MKTRIKFLAAIACIFAIASCGPEENPEPDKKTYDETLKLSDAVLTVGGEGGEVTAKLKTNVDFKVSIQKDVDWVTYKPATKAEEPKDLEIAFTVKEFPKSTEQSRSAVVTISYAGLSDQILTIIQTPTAQIYLEATADETRFTMDGGTMTVTIKSSVDYKIESSDTEWITPDANNPVKGDGQAKFTIAPNKVKSDRDGTVTLTTEGLEPVVINVHQDAFASNIGIKSLADFLEFVAASNNGAAYDDPATPEVEQAHDLTKWVNEDGEICLLCDLDLSSIKEWTPIGNPTDLTSVKKRSIMADSVRVFGNHFNSGNGVFNGMNHVISGLHIVANDGGNDFSGFFGALYKATVKNLIFDETCTMTVNHTSNYASTNTYGFVTASAVASTIENVVVKGTIKINKEYPDGESFRGFYVGGIAGRICGNKQGSAIIRNCRFEGKVEEVVQKLHGSTNPKSFGGIVGYMVHDIGAGNEGDALWADPNYVNCTKIVDCVNNADLNGTIWCMGGIVGSTFNNTIIENCTNNGALNNNSTETNGRTGGIIGYDEGNTTVKGCTNNGAIHALDTKNHCIGGITSVIAGKSDYTNNKVNNTIAGQYKTKGIFVANVNNKDASFSGNLAKGSVADGINKGEYTNLVEVTAENFSTYVGKNGKDAPTYGKGVSFWK